MPNITFKQCGTIGIVTLSRQEQLNAINMAMLKELADILETVRNDGSLHCLVITGAGEKAFAAGADIGEMKNMTAKQAEEFSSFGSGVMRMIERLEIPVLAAVNGYALGGGCELSLCCDIRIAAENAVFGQPEVTLGVIPGFGGSQRLPRAVGIGMASEMIFTGRNITAKEAFEAGLASKVVPKGTALANTLEIAGRIAQNPPMAVRACKKVIGYTQRCEIDAGLAYESEVFAGCFAGAEQKERMCAFVNKRKNSASKTEH